MELHRQYNTLRDVGEKRQKQPGIRKRDQLTRRPSDVRWTSVGLERIPRGVRGWWISIESGAVLDAGLIEDAEHGGVRNALRAALASHQGKRHRTSLVVDARPCWNADS